MTILQMLIIAVVQGVTEFLPISSSGHLILVSVFTGFEDQGPMIDIAVHVGSLLAIMVYFFKDVAGLARGGFATIGIGQAPEYKKLFWWIALGTIPGVLFGLAIKSGALNGVAAGLFGLAIIDNDLMASLRLTDLIAVNLIFYGILLGIADRFGKEAKTFEDMTWRDGLLVGAAQALALIPGTSRSGVTMTMARALGYGRFEELKVAPQEVVQSLLAHCGLPMPTPDRLAEVLAKDSQAGTVGAQDRTAPVRWLTDADLAELDRIIRESAASLTPDTMLSLFSE